MGAHARGLGPQRQQGAAGALLLRPRRPAHPTGPLPTYLTCLRSPLVLSPRTLLFLAYSSLPYYPLAYYPLAVLPLAYFPVVVLPLAYLPLAVLSPVLSPRLLSLCTFPLQDLQLAFNMLGRAVLQGYTLRAREVTPPYGRRAVVP